MRLDCCKTAGLDDAVAFARSVYDVLSLLGRRCLASPHGSVHPDGVVFADLATNTMPKCSLLPRCTGLGAAVSLALLAGPLPSRADVLYTLQTKCSIKGAAPVGCTVEAVNDAAATLYRHRIGDQTITIRISDKPVRMALWNATSKQWQSLERAAALFSTNTVCFNGSALCVVNANYLNSVREDNSAAMARRDLVKVHFGADGRINASCYDDGCEVVQK